MYLPSRYSSASENDLIELVQQFPFATLITGSMVSHVPLVLNVRGGEWVLVGHLARANPHWKLLEGAESLAIFHGPQAYITPLWYEHCDVPTWNYVVAHLSGKAKLLDEEKATIEALKILSDRTEGKSGWAFEIPQDLAEPGVLMKSIIGFEISVSSRVGKFKLSQNKSSTDIEGVMRGLSTRKDEQSRGVLDWMRRLLDKE